MRGRSGRNDIQYCAQKGGDSASTTKSAAGFPRFRHRAITLSFERDLDRVQKNEVILQQAQRIKPLLRDRLKMSRMVPAHCRDREASRGHSTSNPWLVNFNVRQFCHCANDLIGSTTRNFCVDLQCDFDGGVHQSSEMGNDLVSDAGGPPLPLGPPACWLLDHLPVLIIDEFKAFGEQASDVDSRAHYAWKRCWSDYVHE